MNNNNNKSFCVCTIGPSWASTNLGIFICLRCAGIHRSLGSHISFVRSITMDDWTPKQMETMFAIGNVKSTQYYERNKPADKKKPTEFDGVEYVFLFFHYERIIILSTKQGEAKTQKANLRSRGPFFFSSFEKSIVVQQQPIEKSYYRQVCHAKVCG